MNPGKFDKLLAIYACTTTTGPTGATVETWAKVGEVFGRKIPQSGDVSYDAGRETAINRVMFECRFHAAIVQKARIVTDAITYEIVKADDIERRRYMQVTAEQKNI